jgi:hypothetical protein
MPRSVPATLVASLAFPPREDESARGLIVRVAADNLCTATEISAWLGVTDVRSPLGGDLEGAAALLGMPAARFAAMGAVDGETERLLGHAVPTGFLPRWDMAVCPACLAEEPYHRRIWDHGQMGVCPRHRVALRRTCATCLGEGRRGVLTWRRSDMLYCSEGHLLAAQPTDAALGWRGHAALHRHCGLPCEGPDFPAEMRSLPLQALLDIVLFLGRMDLVVARGNPESISGAEMAADPRILEAGAEIAFGWPASFHLLADRVREARLGEAGLSKVYGHLHRFVHHSVGQPYEAMLKAAYAAYLASQPDVSDRAFPDFLEPPVGVGRSLRRSEAAEVLGLGHRAFRRLMASELWNGFTPLLRGADSELLYLRQEVAALRTRLDRLATPSALDGLLGIGRGRGRQIVDAGLVPVFGWNRHSKRNETRSVDVADADALFRAVADVARQDAPECPVGFAALVNRAMARRVVAFPNLMRALVSGAIAVWVLEPWRPGFASLGFEDVEVVRLLDRLSNPEASGKIYLGDVGRRLGVSSDGVRALVGAGLLPEPRKAGGLVFEASAVSAFSVSYVLDRELARLRGVGVTKITGELAAAGKRPVLTVGVRNVAAGAGVYRRADTT